MPLTGIPGHKIKALMCFPFRLDFQMGQTFTEMAQTVQINLRSSGVGRLHYSGSDEYGSHSPGPLQSALHGVRKLRAPSRVPQPRHKASGSQPRQPEAQQRKATARLSLAGETRAQLIHNQSHRSRQARRLDRFSKSTGLRRNLISHGLSASALSSLCIPLIMT